jgi:hypothetical protein
MGNNNGGNDMTRRTWLAMQKFAENKPLTDAEWFDLSALTLTAIG